jgi:hypothetical protein
MALTPGLRSLYPIRLRDTVAREREESDEVVGAFGVVEWAFIALVSLMSVLAGLFAVYVLIQVFRNPSRRRSP